VETTKALPTSEVSRSSESRSIANQSAFESNDLVPAASQQSVQRSLVVEIPKPPSSFQRDNYVAVAESPKRRKLDHDHSQSTSLHLQSQRQVAKAALLQFQNGLTELFEAQDKLEPDTSASYLSHVNSFFELLDDDEDSHPRLSLKVLERLQVSLKQLVSYGNLSDVATDDLRRLQQLCEHSIEAAQTLNLKLPDDPSEDDLLKWRARIRKAENGAASACTVIYTVLGNVQDEALLSAEVLRWLPNVLVNAFENCLILVVESRPEGPNADIHRAACTLKDELKSLLSTNRKLLDLVATVCVRVRGAEGSVNAAEFLAAKLIFVQNPHNEKGSALGTQAFENVRKAAMTALAKIYASFPAERTAILDEILSSLDKLPSTSRSARQFKLDDGKNIQLVSALLMQLVQTTSTETAASQKVGKSSRKLHDETATDDSEGLEDGDEQEFASNAESLDRAEDQAIGLAKLKYKSQQHFDSGARSAQQIIRYIVDKASAEKKTGESAYRSLLDLFIEDLINALAIPDWPSAELLLRFTALYMLELARNEKQSASIKNMALEALGTMGSAISIFRASISGLSSAVARDAEATPSNITQDLLRLVDDQLHGGLRNEDLISTAGPFAVTAHHLQKRGSQSLRAKTAYSYWLAQYAKVVCLTLKSDRAEQDDRGLDAQSAHIITMVLEMMKDVASETHSLSDIIHVTRHEAQLAYTLGVLNLNFCRAFPAILKTLSSSLNSDQAQVRSRSLKSVVNMLESDSSLLDRDMTIAEDVFRCASDDSAMVRDSALSLIAKFIIPKPALEEKGIKRLLECAGDAKVGVQKRAMGHLKDIYLRDTRQNLRNAIARTFLRHTNDVEETVAEFAKRTLAELWISPTLDSITVSSESAKSEVAIKNLSTHIVQTIQSDQVELPVLLKAFFLANIKSDNKTLSQVHQLYAGIADVLFQAIISGTASQESLITLMTLADARPQAVAPQQLSNLKRYLSNVNVKNEQDLLMFKSVISIFRSVLPHLSSTHNTLLKDIQDDLMKSINPLKTKRLELDEVMQCLQVIDGVLGNTIRLIKLLTSVIVPIGNPKSPPSALPSWLRICGSLGKYVDLESHLELFKRELQVALKRQIDQPVQSVAGYIVDMIYTRTSIGQEPAIRTIALESLGSLCQAWPGQFKKKKIAQLFFNVLATAQEDTTSDSQSKIRDQLTVLRMFEELYASRASAKENDGAKSEEIRKEQDLKKLGGDKRTMDQDSAIAMITDDVATRVLRIALTSQGEQAFLATRILSSISHEGLLHPRDSTPAFVALETSKDLRVSEVAFSAHKLLQQTHESVTEREYTRAIQEAFSYQRDVVGDTSGAWLPSFKAKLSPCFNIINGSSSKYIKKFLSNIITRTARTTELSKLDVSQEMPDHVQFARFVAQNVALFEYGKMDELMHTILQLEMSFTKGTAELQAAIEATIQPEVSLKDGTHLPDDAARVAATIEVDKLRPLVAAAIASTVLWEARSHLKQQYGIRGDTKLALGLMKQAKEFGKPPIKVHGLGAENFWRNTTTVLSSFDNTEAMIDRCHKFLALMSEDETVKVPTGDEEILEIGHDDDNAIEVLPPPKRGRKRKSIASPGGTPKKARGRPLKSLRRSSSLSSRDDPEAEYGG